MTPTHLRNASFSRRPYKEAWSVDDATALVLEQGGRYFDPEVVRHFMRLLPEILHIRQDHVEPEPVASSTA